MDDLEDIQYRLEKELDELRPVRTFIRMEGVPPTQPEERTVTEPPANPRPEPFIPRNFRFSTDYDLYPGGAKSKYKNNILAIKTLKQIEAEQRTATSEEQITLARYVGWGGLANAFSDKAAGWESEYQELKALLTEEEYKAAMRSTITAYYTEPELIRYMYRALERFGFEGGPDRRILDPGMGTGNFYSVLPEQYQGSKLYGVGFANLLGRYDEAKAHNSPILEERRQRDEQRKAEREAERRQREQERQASYYTERLICEILMALEQNAVNMGMEYDDCQKAMGGDLSKAAKKEWYLRHKDRGIEP